MDIPCISSNPDITGIGVRTAIYAQNFFSFIPAARVLWDGKITYNELDTMEEQSSTILVTAFALLFTTIIQARSSLGLSNVHATVVLNLSWMNNTNVFIYFLVYTLHRIKHLEKVKFLHKVKLKEGILDEGARVLKNPVFWIGSLHLTLLGAVGLWLWGKPATFGHSDPYCSTMASVVFLGRRVTLTSSALQVSSIFIYSILLVPCLNMILPSALLLAPVWLLHRHSLQNSKHEIPSPVPQQSPPEHPTLSGFQQPPMSHSLHDIKSVAVQLWKKSQDFLLSLWRAIMPVAPGLAILAVVNIFFLVNTELALHDNKELLGEDDGTWTFGQVLALMLLLVPAWSFVGILIERRDIRNKRIKQLVMEAVVEIARDSKDRESKAQELLNEQPDDNVKGK
ncbi:hypothetical protein DXG01_003733 [Tephrocybe rancida]|nr:hypothetical protein DXG01_003733 [Tephrocybe rancida]